MNIHIEDKLAKEILIKLGYRVISVESALKKILGVDLRSMVKFALPFLSTKLAYLESELPEVTKGLQAYYDTWINKEDGRYLHRYDRHYVFGRVGLLSFTRGEVFKRVSRTILSTALC